MSRGLLIRRAGLADVRSILAIEKQSFPAPWSRWSFLTELANPISATLIAGPSPPKAWQTWGYIIYWVVAQVEMHILNLAVHPRQQRQGIGRRLLTEAMGQARALGVQTVWLEVRPSNTPARALYESLGFGEVAVRPKYYADTQEDALIMALSWEAEG